MAASTHDAVLTAKIDHFLEPLVRAHEFSGVVLVTRADKTLVARGYGKANWEFDAPMSMETLFRIASITKTFTGAAVVILAERGRLALKDPLSKYLPDFPKGDKIQIRHLLLHESGVPNPDSRPCSDVTLDEVVSELAKKPLWFEPGTNSGYSNGGYALLAKVIEVVTGRRWEDVLRDEIFVPAGLMATARDSDEAIVPLRAGGYVPGPSPLGLLKARCDSTRGLFGSGALLSTASDLQRWARVVRKETLFKRTALEYPYGWGVRKYYGRDAIEQSGISHGAASYLAEYFKDDVTIVVLSNVQTGVVDDIGKGVAALTFGIGPSPLKAAPRAVAATSALRKPWLGDWKNANIGTFHLVERNGSLYQTWEASIDGSYVFITGEHAAFNTQESGAMELAGDTLRISWGNGKPVEFKRP